MMGSGTEAYLSHHLPSKSSLLPATTSRTTLRIASATSLPRGKPYSAWLLMCLGQLGSHGVIKAFTMGLHHLSYTNRVLRQSKYNSVCEEIET